MIHNNIVETRKNLAELLNKVAYQGERVVLTRHSKGVAALVSMTDLEALEAIDNAADLKAARKALADLKRKGGKPIPWNKAKTELGL